MKKVIFTILLLLVLAVAGVVYYVVHNMEDMVKTAVNKYGSQVTGTQVRLGGFQMSPFDGLVKLNNLTVANPKGYAKPNIISLGSVEVKLDVKSVLNPMIVIERVVVSQPEVTYEISNASRNNISDLLANINKNAKATKAEEEAKPQEGGKKVVVDLLNVVDGKVNVAASLAGQGAAVGLPLPKIEMKNVGREKNAHGQTIAETLTVVLKKILMVSYDTVVKNGLSGLKDVADEATKQVQEKASDTKEGIGGFFKKLFD
ncbi:MAG: AsmA family protein [Alphaproteobacteria bacterium]|nr:AsmA family protein [Alphaproteobacteria bacterium]